MREVFQNVDCAKTFGFQQFNVRGPGEFLIKKKAEECGGILGIDFEVLKGQEGEGGDWIAFFEYD